jgi:uncharacterized membrane protein YtjA (UPF0391 family)
LRILFVPVRAANSSGLDQDGLIELYFFSTVWRVATQLHYGTARPTKAATVSGPILKRRTKMLYYALVFLLIAIVAAVCGFGGVAIVSAGIAKILFFVFIVLFLVSLVTHMSRRV